MKKPDASLPHSQKTATVGYPVLYDLQRRAVSQLISLKKTFFSTGRFVMLSVITNVYKKKIKQPTLKKKCTATGNLKKFFDS
jgi:hypothetical protein